MNFQFFKNCNSSPIPHIFKMKRSDYPYSIPKIKSHISDSFLLHLSSSFVFSCINNPSSRFITTIFPFPFLDFASKILFQFLGFVSYIFTFNLPIIFGFMLQKRKNWKYPQEGLLPSLWKYCCLGFHGSEKPWRLDASLPSLDFCNFEKKKAILRELKMRVCK